MCMYASLFFKHFTFSCVQNKRMRRSDCYVKLFVIMQGYKLRFTDFM